MIVVIGLVLVTVGTVLFHFLSPWWWTPIASNWDIIDTTIQITFVVTGIVFVAILLFTAYCVYRYRYRKDRRSEYKPEDPKLTAAIEKQLAAAVPEDSPLSKKKKKESKSK